MKTLVRFELFKQLRRKENLLVFFMFLMPLFYGLGVNNHSLIVTYTSKELINGLTFADNMYTLVYMVFVIFLILAINSANILKGEIENGSLSMMLNRVNNRRKIYRSKFYAQSIYWWVVTVLFVVFSIGCYYLLVANLPIADGKLISAHYLSDLMTIVATGSLYILAISLVQSLSMYVKSYVSIGLFIVLFVVFVYLKSFPGVQLASPIYHLQQLLDTGKGIDFIRFMALNWGLVLLLNTIGIRKFERSDL